MILSGLCVLESKSLKAAGFADITDLGFINEKWVENELWLPGSCSSSEEKKKDFPHVLSYTLMRQCYLTGYVNLASSFWP